jgi:toxin YoeB
MTILFLPKAWEQYEYWVANDVKMLRRINKLINESTRTPFNGTGKPEPLKGNFKGFWSRRIDDTHRLVYRIDGNNLVILQCRFHYDE